MKLEFTPAGVTFKGKVENVPNIKKGDTLVFEHTPISFGTGVNKKEYPNAVTIKHNDLPVGMVPESEEALSPMVLIRKMQEDGENVTGIASELLIPSESDTFKRTYKINIDVPEEYLPTAEEIAEAEVAKLRVESFTEPEKEVLFDKDKHIYTYNNKRLKSTSIWSKQFISDFDAKAVSKIVATRVGEKPEEVENMWSDGGTLAADFGTVVHAAMEFYTKYRALASRMMITQGNFTDRALPKHPILRNIVREFTDNIVVPNGTHYPEAVITDVENGMCGMVDDLVVTNEKKKECRIGDYKVNIDADKLDKYKQLLKPFDKLPACKLSEYQLKMSYYARILQNKGWKVTGLDVYVYEDSWKHYELDVLPIEDELLK